MKQQHKEALLSWSSCMTVGAGGDYIPRTVSITIPSLFADVVQREVLVARQRDVQPYGLHKKGAPLSYINDEYRANVTEQVDAFLLRFFVINILYTELRERKISLIGRPRLTGIATDGVGNTVFNFVLTTVPEINISDWKFLVFRAPKRKRYKDLDKQVELFMREEEQRRQEHVYGVIGVGDWVNFDVALANEHREVLFDGHAENMWLKIGNEEVDGDFHELFVGRRIGDVIYTQNDGLQEYFSGQADSPFTFCVTIKDIVASAFVCLESLAEHFRARAHKALHHKLIEVFSYRNDISQRQATVDDVCQLFLAKHTFFAPHFLVLRQQEQLLLSMQSNPDYLVYKTQKDFQKTTELLAEKQVKEAIIMDRVAHHEPLDVTHEDVRYYLNLTGRPRMREFLHFRLPDLRVHGQEFPIITQELMQTCLREKALNYIIYHLTKK